jgi:hypothetical protein
MSAVVRQGPWMSPSALPSFRGILHPQDATPDDGEATMRRHKHRTVQFLALALAALSLLAAPSGAGAEERRATGGGVCRDRTCRCTKDQLQRGWHQTAQGCSACNPEALQKAKEDFERWYGIYKDLNKNYQSLQEGAAEAYNEASKLFEERFSLGEGVTEIGKEVTFHQIEKIVEEEGSERAAKLVGTGLATLSIAQMVTDMLDTEARMVTKGAEGMRYAAGAKKTGEAVINSLKKAIEARRREDAMEKACKPNSASGNANQDSQGKGSKDDSWKSSGQKEAEAAQKLLQSWKRVYGGYEDMNGDFHQSELAAEEALEVVRSRKHASLDGGYMFVSLTLSDRTDLAEAQGGSDKLSPAELQKFVRHMGRALRYVEKAAKAFTRIGEDLDRISKLQKSRSASRN